MQEALGLGKSHGGLLKDFLSKESIKLHIDNDLAMELENPFRFTRPGRGGIPALAYEATILPRLCDAILEARKRSKLSKRQLEIADQCEIITRVLSKVGIISLVDEVTGYQEVRDKESLQALLDVYLRKEFAVWAKRFPNDFYQQIFRLMGWEWQSVSVKRPILVGKLTNNVVYERLAPGILEELGKKNPKDENGKRNQKHHQWLTEEIGHPALSHHLHAVIGLMRASKDWKEFQSLLDKAFPKKSDVIQLELI